MIERDETTPTDFVVRSWFRGVFRTLLLRNILSEKTVDSKFGYIVSLKRWKLWRWLEVQDNEIKTGFLFWFLCEVFTIQFTWRYNRSTYKTQMTRGSLSYNMDKPRLSFPNSTYNVHRGYKTFICVHLSWIYLCEHFTYLIVEFFINLLSFYSVVVLTSSQETNLQRSSWLIPYLRKIFIK